jgi:hypothetical protein
MPCDQNVRKKRRECGNENTFEESMAEISPNLARNINLQIRDKCKEPMLTHNILMGKNLKTRKKILIAARRKTVS